MKLALTACTFLLLMACDTPAFDSDKRQIQTKDFLRRQVRRNRSLVITRFKEDTLDIQQANTNERPIVYTIDFNYKDSTGSTLNKKAAVRFTPDGYSIIQADIIDAP